MELANIFIYQFLKENLERYSIGNRILLFFLYIQKDKIQIKLFVGYICNTDLSAYKNIKIISA